MVNYYFALGVLVLFILAAMPWAILGLSNQLGRCASSVPAVKGGTVREGQCSLARQQQLGRQCDKSLHCACKWTPPPPRVCSGTL
jgi:hypothetical protein